MTPDAIRTFRKRLGLSQAELARALKVTKHTVWRWEQEPTKGKESHRAAPEFLRLALEQLLELRKG